MLPIHERGWEVAAWSEAARVAKATAVAAAVAAKDAALYVAVGAMVMAAMAAKDRVSGWVRQAGRLMMICDGDPWQLSKHRIANKAVCLCCWLYAYAIVHAHIHVHAHLPIRSFAHTFAPFILVGVR